MGLCSILLVSVPNPGKEVMTLGFSLPPPPRSGGEYIGSLITLSEADPLA